MAEELNRALTILSERGAARGARSVFDEAVARAGAGDEVPDLASRKVTPPLGTRLRRKPLAVAVAAFCLVLIAVGGVSLVLRRSSPEVAEGPSVVSTTVATPTTAVTTTSEPTTSVPTTTLAPTSTLAPPTPLGPYAGSVPDLDHDWLQLSTVGGWPGAASSDLGLVTFGEREIDSVTTAAQAYYSTDGSAWDVATGFDAPEGEPGNLVRFVAEGPTGFVAVIPGPPLAFFSADGRVWDPPVEPWNDGGVNDIAAGPPGYVLVGATSTCEPRTAFSPDGRDWQLIDLPGGCAASGVAWTGAHFVLVSSLADGTVDAVMTSPDGVDWSTVDVQQAPGPIGTWGVYVAGSGDTVALLGTDTSMTPAGLEIWYSTDLGRNWFEATINEAERAPAGEFQTWQLIYSDFGYFAAGGIETLTSEFPGFLLWSPDGGTWYPFITDDSRRFFGVAVLDDTVFGFGTGVWCWNWSQ